MNRVPAMIRHPFTLIEVVVALAILGVSLVGMLQLMMTAQQRIAKSYDQWLETHILMQAAEYYLLQPGEDPPSIPTDFFPYTDYQVNCLYQDAEDLPDDFTNLVGQLPLRTCVIELTRGRDRKTIATLYVDRISYESTVSGQ